MNDLRSHDRGLAAVPDEGSAPTSTPPRVRPERAALAEPDGARTSRRQSMADRAGAPTAGSDGVQPADDHKFRSSRPASTAVVADGELTTGRRQPRGDGGSAPASRPTRRRDLAEEEAEDEDRFPWHFQYEDDEPREMQASSPLLSRAFRSSTG